MAKSQNNQRPKRKSPEVFSPARILRATISSSYASFKRFSGGNLLIRDSKAFMRFTFSRTSGPPMAWRGLILQSSASRTTFLDMKLLRKANGIALAVAAVLMPFFVGCASDNGVEALREPHVDGRIKSVQYDSTRREPKRDIAVIHGEPTQAVNAIAYFTAEAPVPEETKIIKGMIDKARWMGADALVVLPPTTHSGGQVNINIGRPAPPFLFGGGKDTWIFRANAVVYK